MLQVDCTLGFLLPLEDGVRDGGGLQDGHGDVHDVAVDFALHARRYLALFIRLHVDQHLLEGEKE